MKKNILLVLALSLAVFGCKKENPLETSPTGNPRSGARVAVDNPDGLTELGPQLMNPYTPENMTTALNVLSAQGAMIPQNFTVRTTHYYVKYMPENWEQYVQLHADSAHTYFDYPLDREITKEGNTYHDPAVADSMPEFQYAAIEAGTSLDNGVPYEVLSPLYIPEQDESIANSDFAEQLLDQAYIQTENFGDTVKHVDAKARRAPYRPAGQILIHDNRLNQNIGLEGVLVTARRWFTVFRGRADYNGNFQVNGVFQRDCNYSAHYEAFGFNVRANLINIIAYINGPKQSGDWNTTINGGYNNFAGDVFRGAYYYHYKNISGILRPFNPSGKFTSYIAKSGSGGVSGINWGIVPVIKIWEKNSGGVAHSDDEIFSTTCHETAHLTHNILLGLNLVSYLSVRTEIRESWATAVEWWLTGLEYKSRGISNYGDANYHATGAVGYNLESPNDNGYQYWSLSISPQYTSLFINCIDYNNEIGQTFATRPTGTVDDQIGRYHPGSKAAFTIAQVENLIIKHSVNLATVTTNIKNNKPAGVTDADVDLLMSFY